MKGLLPPPPEPLTFVSGGLDESPVKRAVHVVHPGALPSHVYRNLADAMPAGVAVSVLDVGCLAEYWQAALTGRPMDLTVVDIAAQLRELSARLNPAGLPLTLAGWSFGGAIAYEMLLQSPAEQRPGRLVVLDSIAPVADYQQDEDNLSADLLFDWFAMYLGAKRARALAPLQASPVASVDERLGLLLEEAIRCGVLSADTAPEGIRKVWDVYVQGLVRNARLSRGYTPTTVEHPTVLVRPTHGLLQVREPLGWEQLVGSSLTVATCPGNHYTMLTDPTAVSQLAGILAPAAAGAAAGPAPALTM